MISFKSMKFSRCNYLIVACKVFKKRTFPLVHIHQVLIRGPNLSTWQGRWNRQRSFGINLAPYSFLNEDKCSFIAVFRYITLSVDIFSEKAIPKGCCFCPRTSQGSSGEQRRVATIFYAVCPKLVALSLCTFLWAQPRGNFSMFLLSIAREKYLSSMQCLNKYFISNVKERCLNEFTSKCYTTFMGIKFL